MITLSVVGTPGKTITFQWAPVAGAQGYLFYKDDMVIPVSRSFDPTKTTTRFAYSSTSKYKVEAIKFTHLDEGVYPIPPPPSVPPTTATNSLKAGQVLSGIYNWLVTTNGDCQKVEFWADATKLGEIAGSSPYSFSFDTTKVANGSHLFGVVEVDSAGVRYKDPNRVTASVANLSVKITGTPVKGQSLQGAIV